MEPRELFLSLTNSFSTQIAKASSPKEMKKIFKDARNKFEKLQKDSLASSNSEIACTKGCAYCCYLTVTLRAHEIVQILEFINTKLSKSEISNIIKRAEINMKQMLPLSHDECGYTNIKCPLLSDAGSCMCYEVRPFSCHKFNSRNANLCRLCYENPKANITGGSIYDVDVSAAIIIHSLADAFDNNGYDRNVYYLNHSLYEGLTNPKVIKRWRKKKKTFSKYALSKEIENLAVNE